MKTVMSYLGAIGAAQREAMDADERVIIIGEDVEANVYGTTGAGKARAAEGDFLQRYGRNRIRNTPISEEIIVGAAAGAAMTGLRPLVDLSYSSFTYLAMDQFVNQIAKNRFMFGGQASIPVVFRSAMFYGLNTGAHHSDRPYPMYMNVPGLKIIAPASPSDAKGLLRSAIDSDDPVLSFEACPLWPMKEEVEEDEIEIFWLWDYLAELVDVYKINLSKYQRRHEAYCRVQTNYYRCVYCRQTYYIPIK